MSGPTRTLEKMVLSASSQSLPGPPGLVACPLPSPTSSKLSEKESSGVNWYFRKTPFLLVLQPALLLTLAFPFPDLTVKGPGALHYVHYGAQLQVSSWGGTQTSERYKRELVGTKQGPAPGTCLGPCTHKHIPESVISDLPPTFSSLQLPQLTATTGSHEV